MKSDEQINMAVSRLVARRELFLADGDEARAVQCSLAAAGILWAAGEPGAGELIDRLLAIAASTLEHREATDNPGPETDYA